MEVNLISWPEESELIAKMAGIICYSEEKSLEQIRQKAEEKKDDYLRKIIESGHMSILEHNIFVFHITGVSRVLTHQLVRKRIASFSQQSQRYVDAKNFDIVIPTKIKNSSYAEKYTEFAKKIFQFYEEMVLEGIPREDARYILPNATTTQLIVSMNAHALIDFFAVRCCRRAQNEITKLAYAMLDEVKKAAPVLFENAGAHCDFYGYCPENEKSCGRAVTLAELKEEMKKRK